MIINDTCNMKTDQKQFIKANSSELLILIKYCSQLHV